MGEIQDLIEEEENFHNLEQMRECLCIIKNKNNKGIGFFCCINNQNINIFIMITTNKLVNDDILKNVKKIEIILNKDDKENKIIKIDENRKIYTSIKYDITIIEINPKDDDIHKFLNIEEKIFEQNINFEKIYILQYINDKEKLKKIISKGIIKQINDYNIKYVCNSSLSLPGCPLLNLYNHKVIGIHKESLFNFNNNGILLKNPLNIYINDILNNNKKNEINMRIRIDKNDINKKIPILYGDSTSFFTSYKVNGVYSSYSSRDLTNKIKEIYNSNIELYINNIKHNFNTHIKAEKEGIYDIKLKFFHKHKDCSDMFSNCENIIFIDLSFFDSSNITDTSYMFANCKNLEKIDFSSFDTKNVTDMSHMFNNCNNLKNLNLSFFNTKNVENMNSMFYKCYNLYDLYLSSFDTKKVTNMGSMFSNCYRLIKLDLSSFNTENVINIYGIFFKCYSLTFLKLFSSTGNIESADYLFYDCYNLPYVDLTSFNLKLVYKKKDIFSNCINLLL